jgi:catechol 2,3-dioxygenase-like lactoylglutathione lyase family enzyme
MKRFHVHVAVDDLQESIRFYSTLFGAEPSIIQRDYAKWMLEDPRLNFAISNRRHGAGLDHLGFQVESDEELKNMHAQLETADARLFEQTGANCCYAHSDKYWVRDPSGIAWETFHTLASVPTYGDDTHTNSEAGACCISSAHGTAEAEDDAKAGRSCCAPTTTTDADLLDSTRRARPSSA